MKRIVMAICLMGLLAGCTESTEYGPCVGLADKPNPTLLYKTSAWNIIMGIIFCQTIVVPVVVIAGDFSCPYAKAPITYSPAPIQPRG